MGVGIIKIRGRRWPGIYYKWKIPSCNINNINKRGHSS